MLGHKHITKIVAVLVAAAVVLCFASLLFAKQLTELAGGVGVSEEYESKLFDTDEVMSVNIMMDETEWNEMLQNAMGETYYQCDVEINGSMFYRVGIRPKGNTSLTNIASDPNSDRFSLKLEFDQYVDGQTCFGLDKLILNNNYADATNMKEALIYDMYHYLGADSSLYNYAKISVNGEYWGVYLALEAVEDSFLLRNYGVSSGELYKPDTMDFGEAAETVTAAAGDLDFSSISLPTPGNAQQPFAGASETMPQMPNDFDASQIPDQIAPSQFGVERPDGEKAPSQFGVERPDGEKAPSQFGIERPEGEDFAPSSMAGGMFGGVMSGGGANLNYTDDDLDSYSEIWDAEVTSTKTADHKRVVEALKNIAEGNDLEKYMDVDNLLKYMAVHVFSVNEDSLSGMMSHNYYLYEEDGRLNLIPWDYNLSLGGMGGGNDATSIVNDAIDNAFSGTDFFDTLMENEEYHAQYYAYLRKLVDEYLLGDGFETFYQRTRSQIDELVETDPNAFYTYEEYLTAADTLYQVVKLRGESIDGQVNGTIPSTAAAQRNSDALIDASSLDLSVMGSMESGGGRGGFGPSQAGSRPEDIEGANSALDLADEERKNETGDNTGKETVQEPNDNRSEMPTDFPGFSDRTSTMSNHVLYGISGAVLLVGLLFAKFYHRRNRWR